MKKLVTIILILALLLPAASLADDLCIARHYTIHIDGTSPALRTQYGSRLFDYDSFTMDLFLTNDLVNGYMFQTQYTSGIFLNSGMIQCKIATVMDQKYLVNGSGDNFPIMEDDESDDLWINFGRGYFRMHLVDIFNSGTDWK